VLCVQRKAPDDGQKNCLKLVEFNPKNKFEKSVNFVGFIIRYYHDARSPERQIHRGISFTIILTLKAGYFMSVNNFLGSYLTANINVIKLVTGCSSS